MKRIGESYLPDEIRRKVTQVLPDEITRLKQELVDAREDAERLAAVLQEDALWAFDSAAPIELKASFASPVGSLTQGPNNCAKFFRVRKDALKQHEALTTKHQ